MNAAYRLVDKGHVPQGTAFTVRSAKIGAGRFTVIAGPCAVESREQIFECARIAKEAGAHVLRAGCFKPRTSPYSFQGLGLEGLRLLSEASREFDLPTISEVGSEEEVLAADGVVDILQVGSRNMQNFALLRAVGRAKSPVLLKRGMSATIEELLLAAEYIMNEGQERLFLCERGIRTFERATRNTLDISAVPVVKECSHLPIIVDPSHAAGRRSLVPALARAAKAVGADGLMVEFHPDPENALSDGAQSMHPADFKALMLEILPREISPTT